MYKTDTKKIKQEVKSNNFSIVKLEERYSYRKQQKKVQYYYCNVGKINNFTIAPKIISHFGWTNIIFIDYTIGKDTTFVEATNKYVTAVNDEERLFHASTDTLTLVSEATTIPGTVLSNNIFIIPTFV